MPKLGEEKLKAKVWQNTLETCEYVSGYVNSSSILTLKCTKHNHIFTTSYENVRRDNRPHHVCPLCQQEDLNKNKIETSCDYCGKIYLLSASKYENNEFHFCCRECKDNAQRLDSGERFNKLRPEHYGRGSGIYSYRERAFYTYEHKCAICGWNEDEDVLQVHHIDENRQNNELDNLIILCPNCHQKLTIHKYHLVGREKIELD